MDNRPLVLVADDEPQITKLVAMTLNEEGFRVVTARDGEEALDRVASMRPDVVLLDIVMPGLDGIEVMHQLREWHPVPVILLTARSSKADVANGLDLGADDYIAKPLHPRELAARVRAVLRRASRVAAGQSLVQIGEFQVDLTRRIVTRNGEFVPFSRTEWLLLQHLASNVGRVMTHGELLTEVWGPEYRDDLTYLRLWIGRLRRKLGVEPGREGPIKTFQGLGYALDTEGILERAGPRSGAPTAPQQPAAQPVG
jgi:two-component system KDP operon response regulator KdpE